FAMSTYDSYEPRSNFGLFVFLAFLAAALIGIGSYLFQSNNSEEPAAIKPASPQNPEIETVVKKVEPKPFDPFDTEPEPEPEPVDTVAPSTPEQILVDAGMGAAELKPEVLLEKIGKSLEESDLVRASMLIGRKALDESQLEGLRKLAAIGDFRLSSMDPVMEIGELEANRKSRWALNFEGEKGARIYFDLLRGNTGGWGVEKMKLFDQEATGRAIFVDSLGITDAFLRAVLEQNFDDAKSLVDPESVSDAKIAGLCIIFEEAKYRLRTQKPLRAMFNRELSAGFIAHVEDETGEKAADFGLNVQRKTIDQPWQVTEVNLDSLLADYADRVAGGDVHYTPLIKNPTGGDTLILYFGFDEDVLTPRTERQLDIVAGLLKTDPDKELTLSGHTDSLGTDQYNNKLSERRAGAVEKYLLSLGVPRKQIVALAEGEAKPRRPNSTADGEDNPSGRRANRRTEIYLDF
ncbi:OmpA family protein, partial [Akkermansiaceae bacterium]|nr:OmpA family protein [Akkermansiaceae bacterium]